MIKVIVRSHKLLWEQYINWNEVIKYIDSLKSIKYKAFIKNTYNKQNNFNGFLISSPLVMLLVCKESINDLDMKLSTFEVGYLIFCLSYVSSLDISFFHYYWNDYKIKFIKVIKFFLVKIQYSLIISFLEQYILYLRYLCSISSLKLYQMDDLLYKKTECQVYRCNYSLLLDIQSSISYLSILTFLKKIPAFKGVLSLLWRLFNLDYFDSLMSNFSRDYIFVNKNKVLRKILEFFILYLSYELSVLSNKYFNNGYCVSRIVFLYDYNYLLFLCHDSCQLLNLRKKITDLLSIYNILLKVQDKRWPNFLSRGISTGIFLISIKYEAYPFYFLIKPSLRYQFALMKQVSRTLSNSRSAPFFLINVRLNMLILLWSKIFFKYSVNKIFYLLDYLMGLKLRYFYKYFNYDGHFNIKLFKKIFYNYRSSVILRQGRFRFFINLYNRKYYKSYFIVKLLWIYRLEC